MLSGTGRGLAPDFLSCYWSKHPSVRATRALIGQLLLWEAAPALGSVVADVRYVPVLGSDRESVLPQNKFQKHTVSVQSASHSGSGTDRSAKLPCTQTETFRTPQNQESQSFTAPRGPARRGGSRWSLHRRRRSRRAGYWCPPSWTPRTSWRR